MGTNRELHEGEYVIVRVTPVPVGVVWPFLATLVSIALVGVAVSSWSWAHRHMIVVSLVLVAPFAMVLGTRIWRWRARSITLTNERVLVVTGVTTRRRRSLELVDITSSYVDQRWHERLTRRGVVVLETLGGPFVLDRVRRPDALWRVIDHQRRQMDHRDHSRLERAEELSRLRDAGELTDEEYDERWRHLFGPGGIRG